MQPFIQVESSSVGGYRRVSVAIESSKLQAAYAKKFIYPVLRHELVELHAWGLSDSERTVSKEPHCRRPPKAGIPSNGPSETRMDAGSRLVTVVRGIGPRAA